MKTMCQHYVRSSSHVSRLPQWFDTDIYWSYFAPLLTPINLDPKLRVQFMNGEQNGEEEEVPRRWWIILFHETISDFH